ncbi:MAG: hydrogenase iron-sulfur subunit [Chloroflexi bacterium]|nr:hydrogenase iron-sulfur subunit [Chloroflexota bacterium]
MAHPGAVQFRPKISVFHCINAFANTGTLGDGGCEIHGVKLPCSSMIREVFLLRAFEAGADGVVVLACPEGKCVNVSGNLRAAKRVARMKKLVDEIGLDGRRLSFFNIAPGDEGAAERAMAETVQVLAALGPNPATGHSKLQMPISKR